MILYHQDSHYYHNQITNKLNRLNLGLIIKSLFDQVVWYKRRILFLEHRRHLCIHKDSSATSYIYWIPNLNFRHQAVVQFYLRNNQLKRQRCLNLSSSDDEEQPTNFYWNQHLSIQVSHSLPGECLTKFSQKSIYIHLIWFDDLWHLPSLLAQIP